MRPAVALFAAVLGLLPLAGAAAPVLTPPDAGIDGLMQAYDGQVPGAAVLFDTAWVLAMVLPLFLYLHLVVIAAEEKLLSAEFGADYARMCREVPRWFLFL